MQNLKEIINILIPLFDKYPFISAKIINYKYFKEACQYKYKEASNRSLTLEEVNYFNNLKSKMNFNLSYRDIQVWEDKNRLNGRVTPYQLLGFIEGDGSFMIMGQSPCFAISQHLNSESTLDIVDKFFRDIPGRDIFIYKYNIPNSVVPSMQKSLYKKKESAILNYRMVGLDAIYYYLLPFF